MESAVYSDVLTRAAETSQRLRAAYFEANRMGYNPTQIHQKTTKHEVMDKSATKNDKNDTGNTPEAQKEAVREFTMLGIFFIFRSP